MVKRAFDIAASLVVLAVLAPFFPLLTITIKLDSKGPVFFRQQRVGRGGRPFVMLKFRTMAVGSSAQGEVSVKDDPRITRVGRWLRRSKVDELPTVLNVLRGDMSIVGPRPEVPRYVALYTAEQREVLSVRPGITDFGTLVFNDEADILGSGPDAEQIYVERVLPEKLALNLEYIKRRSMAVDIAIIFKTLLLMVKRNRV